jgi:hypothetical protein
MPRLSKSLLPLLLLSGAAISIPAAVALAQQAGAASGVSLGYRDMDVKPGDDFDAFANGGWRKATEMPSDRSSVGVSYEVFLKAEQRNADLIRQAGAGNPARGTPQRMIADYYAAYMDTAGIERRGLAPLQPRLAAIDAIDSKASPARPCAPTSIRSTPPISRPRICSGFGSPRRSTIRAATRPICSRAGSECPTANIMCRATPTWSSSTAPIATMSRIC